MTFIPAISAVVINCHYYVSTFEWIGNVYGCELISNLSIISPGMVISEASGDHQSSKTNNHVEAFDNHKAQTINFIPRNLSVIFPKLIAITINNGRIKEVHQDDLKEYIKLKYLSLTNNDITILEMNLFNFNPELELLALNKNKIKQVHLTTFDNLNKLHTLYMNENECATGTEYDNSKALKLIEEIKQNCTSSDKPNKSNV